MELKNVNFKIMDCHLPALYLRLLHNVMDLIKLLVFLIRIVPAIIALPASIFHSHHLRQNAIVLTHLMCILHKFVLQFRLQLVFGTMDVLLEQRQIVILKVLISLPAQGQHQDFVFLLIFYAWMSQLMMFTNRGVQIQVIKMVVLI